MKVLVRFAWMLEPAKEVLCDKAAILRRYVILRAFAQCLHHRCEKLWFLRRREIMTAHVEGLAFSMRIVWPVRV